MNAGIIEALRNAAVLSALAGVAAAATAQLQVVANRRAAPVTYFGGHALPDDVSPEGAQRDGARERAGLLARPRSPQRRLY